MHKKGWRGHTRAHTRTHTHTCTHLQTGKLQLVYNKKTPNIIQNKKKNKLQKKLVL